MVALKQPAIVHPHRSGREGERGCDKDKPRQSASHITAHLSAGRLRRLKCLRSGFFRRRPPTARDLLSVHMSERRFPPPWTVDEIGRLLCRQGQRRAEALWRVCD